MSHLKPYVAHDYIKNQPYLIALRDYNLCIDLKFKKFRDDHEKLNHYIENRALKSSCHQHAEILKKIVNEGGLEYDNLLK
jgi:hypothetical protein